MNAFPQQPDGIPHQPGDAAPGAYMLDANGNIVDANGVPVQQWDPAWGMPQQYHVQPGTPQLPPGTEHRVVFPGYSPDPNAPQQPLPPVPQPQQHAMPMQPQPAMAAATSWSAVPTAMPAPMAQVPAAGRPARDPSRTALAAVITFIVALVGLWAILAYLHNMAVTLSSINSGNKKMVVQLQEANKGLVGLEARTNYVSTMNADTELLGNQMVSMDADMKQMISGVGTIGTNMRAMNSTLGSLSGSLDDVSATNESIAAKLGGISEGLKAKDAKVARMNRDVQGSAVALGGLARPLKATNSRLAYINQQVCFMGIHGMSNMAQIAIKEVIGLGTVTIKSTVVPPGGWTC